jgi:hypothetical protein
MRVTNANAVVNMVCAGPRKGMRICMDGRASSNPGWSIYRRLMMRIAGLSDICGNFLNFMAEIG